MCFQQHDWPNSQVGILPSPPESKGWFPCCERERWKERCLGMFLLITFIVQSPFQVDSSDDYPSKQSLFKQWKRHRWWRWLHALSSHLLFAEMQICLVSCLCCHEDSVYYICKLKYTHTHIPLFRTDLFNNFFPEAGLCDFEHMLITS